MQGIRDRGWAVCCGQEVDSGDAWVESRRKRASAKQPEEIIRKDKRKKTADATEIPDGRGRTWSCIQGKWCSADGIWKLHNGNQKTDQRESSFRGSTSLRQPPSRAGYHSRGRQETAGSAQLLLSSRPYGYCQGCLYHHRTAGASPGGPLSRRSMPEDKSAVTV